MARQSRRGEGAMVMSPTSRKALASHRASPSLSRGAPSWHNRTTRGEVSMRPNLFEPTGENVAHAGPGIALLHQPPAGGAERTTPHAIPEQRQRLTGERRGLIGQDNLAVGDKPEAFGPHRGREHGLAHGQSLENLEPRAAPDAERDDGERP